MYSIKNGMAKKKKKEQRGCVVVCRVLNLGQRHYTLLRVNDGIICSLYLVHVLGVSLC